MQPSAAPRGNSDMDRGRPLKIGITCYPSVGGSGILASELGEELAQRGHEVHFISYEQPFRMPVGQPRAFFHPSRSTPTISSSTPTTPCRSR